MSFHVTLTFLHVFIVENMPKGLRVYEEMEGLFGVSPGDFTLTSVLATCSELALFPLWFSGPRPVSLEQGPLLMLELVTQSSIYMPSVAQLGTQILYFNICLREI